MALEKLSPRQKMINMMYLVLLAILALNVSAEALDAFVRLKSQLRETAVEANRNGDDLILRMKAEIDREVENQGKTTNVGLKDTLEELKSRTRSVITLIEQHLDTIEAMADWDPELAEYIRKDEQEENLRYWMGRDESANQRRGNGQAYALRDSFDHYFMYLADLHNSQVVDSLRIEPTLTQDPQSTLDPGKRWEESTFEGPVVGNLATLEALKLEIYRRQQSLLELLNTRLGVNAFVPDTVTPISAPLSRIVPAGLPFTTRLYVGMSSKSITPEFASGSGSIQLEDGGNTAILSVMANGNVVPVGEAEGIQRYSAVIRVPKATGGYQELTLEESFTVRKPAVSITSAAVQQLYRNCGNDLFIDVPVLGELYDPRVSASEATIRQANDNPKRFLIIPTGRRSVVTVKSQTNGQLIDIDQLTYNVIDPPKPSLELLVEGRPYSLTQSIPANSRFSVRLVPDPEFRRSLPRDARYGVQSVEFLLKDGLQPARVVGQTNLQGRDATQPLQLRVPSEVLRARSGSKLFIRVNGIHRVNYQGNRVPDQRFSEWDRTFAIDLR